jgi:hypothetical protein
VAFHELQAAQLAEYQHARGKHELTQPVQTGPRAPEIIFTHRFHILNGSAVNFISINYSKIH